MLVTGQAQGITDGEVVPQELMQRRVFVDPDDLADGHNGNAVGTGLNKIVLCDEHILRCQLGEGGKLFLCLLEHFPWIAVRGKATDLPRIDRVADIEEIGQDAEDGKQSGRDIGKHKKPWQEAGGIRLGQGVM